MPTATLAEEILTPGEGRIRALIVSGGNPAVAFPDHELTLRALDDLELLVVIDHRMTPTAEFADYVIAPTLSLERADVPHLMDRWFRAPYTNYTEPGRRARRRRAQRVGGVLGAGVAARQRPAVPGRLARHDGAPDTDEIIDRCYAGSRMPLDEVRANRRQVHMRHAGWWCSPPRTAPPPRFTPAPDDLMAELAAGARRAIDRCSPASTCPTTRSASSAAG